MSSTNTLSPFLQRATRRRQIDFEIMVNWIEEGSRVLDLGCGRGVLLKELERKRNVSAIGVDSDPSKVASCIRRGVSVVQDDISVVLNEFGESFFDYIIFSRTLEMISEPGKVIDQALRIGRSVLVGTINRGFWRNRIQFFLQGRGVKNDVYPLDWEVSPLTNHLSIGELRAFVARENLEIRRSFYLKGDWSKRCRFMPSCLAGYGIFEIGKKS